MIRLPSISDNTFANGTPYPHIMIDDVIDTETALKIQREILDIPMTAYGRYSNPFEQKWTLSNKTTMPLTCTKLFCYLESDEFIDKLSKIVGKPLVKDHDKNFWGIHLFENGDKLDIHVDAGQHPQNGLKKAVTLGIYLSYNWSSAYGGALELWEGENCVNIQPKLTKCCKTIDPLFNRAVIFDNTDYSWHGSPIPVSCPIGSKRIFLTM